jgi:hypothetical protein
MQKLSLGIKSLLFIVSLLLQNSRLQIRATKSIEIVVREYVGFMTFNGLKIGIVSDVHGLHLLSSNSLGLISDVHFQ